MVSFRAVFYLSNLPVSSEYINSQKKPFVKNFFGNFFRNFFCDFLEKIFDIPCSILCGNPGKNQVVECERGCFVSSIQRRSHLQMGATRQNRGLEDRQSIGLNFRILSGSEDGEDLFRTSASYRGPGRDRSPDGSEPRSESQRWQ